MTISERLEALNIPVKTESVPLKYTIDIVLSGQDLLDFLDDDVDIANKYCAELERCLKELYDIEEIDVDWATYQLVDKITVDGLDETNVTETVQEIMNRMTIDWDWLLPTEEG